MNTGQPDHMGLYTVMYVAQCKWNQRVVVNTCLHSQMIIHGTRLFTSEKHTGHQIMKLNILAEDDVKVLRSDNGGEYTSNNFAKFCGEKGISHEFTVPYCPQQTGVAERMNRTNMEGARPMLFQAKLPLEFRAEACSTAVYLHNRSPTTALKDETPFERLFGRRPDISHLRVFGCVRYVHVPDGQRRKLDTYKSSQINFCRISSWCQRVQTV